MALDPNILLQGANLRAAQSQDLTRTLQGIVKNYQLGQQRKEAKLDKQRAAEMQPDAIMDKAIQLGGLDKLSPQEQAILQREELKATRQQGVDQWGNVYQKNAPIMGQLGGMNMGGGMTPDFIPQGQISQQYRVPQLPQGAIDESMIAPNMPMQKDPSSLPPVMPQIPVEGNRMQQGEATKANIELQKEYAKSEFEKRKARPQQDKSFTALSGDISNIMGVIDDAIDNVSGWSAGRGSLLAGIPETDASDLAETMKTIEADAAFGSLQQMRDNSKSGGALGQVSERELGLLSAAKAALSTKQSPDQLKANLTRFKSIRQEALKNVAEAYKSDYGEYPKGYKAPTKKKRKRYNPETRLVE